MPIARRLAVSGCAATGTTAIGARLFGARFFLPEVLVHRFAHLAGVTPDRLARQLSSARSFSDRVWVEHWEAIARDHSDAAEAALAALARRHDTTGLGDLVAPAARLLVARGPAPRPALRAEFVRDNRTGDHRADSEMATAAIAVDEMLRSTAYRTIAAWPGWTPHRIASYARVRERFDALLAAVAPPIGLDIGVAEVPVDGHTVRIHTVFPRGQQRVPVVLVTNGLDGTAYEVLLPLLKYGDRGLGFVVTEMPGIGYANTEPIAVAPERIYRGLLDHVAAHPRADPGRIAMLGMSFGAYWTVRLAASDPRLCCAVASGAPTHRSFGPRSALGVPDVLLAAMRNTLGASSVREMGIALGALSIRQCYADIAIPLLVVAGERDSIVSARDSIDLAKAAPLAELVLYPGDDHCAIHHHAEWLDHAIDWIGRHTRTGPLSGACSVRRRTIVRRARTGRAP